MHKVKTVFAAAILASVVSSSGAYAQLALGNGVSATVSGAVQTGTGITTMDLGDASTIAAWSQNTSMPLSLSYGSVSATITFGAGSALETSTGGILGPGNYLLASNNGLSLNFSQTQSYFSTRWAYQTATDTFQFYNGTQLVATATGSDVMAPTIAATGQSYPVTGYVGFTFGELGYDRVVVTAAANTAVEFDTIQFGDNVQVAPIPLNAASFGGLMSFLMMLGMRGKGGAQVAFRMAVQSLSPRRRTLAA
ncbi:MAG: hypothetical protein JWN93_2453 [Hyphomicrobiales bacterium]|nr:hypothetical protein [Hyphomicrobiales bacterium]